MSGILILAVSLSIDAVGIGFTYGIRKISISVVAKTIVFILSFLFTAASVYIGSQLAEILPGDLAKYMGVVILAVMGLYIILQSLRKEKDGGSRQQYEDLSCEKKETTLVNIVIRALGITIKIIRDPKTGDFNKSNSIEPIEAIYIGTALSIDSIGSGIGSAALGFSSPAIPVAVAVAQILFLSVGHVIGGKVLNRKKKESRLQAALPGILLITLAIMKML